ncbi:hypothetical protein [Erythrobacter sp. BLCC-B19]|uniref:hypothetical protein n=1 Tax=Erythrobacter sp. BLCC-B19 TaxID=3025315 RepID=UPI00235F0720|nr:hypothetical protein [Erythrobacter sp. BLCC-B19]WDA41874.1 hypothetical protein PS060_03440 [Erythrobacter sp. BLCC-B19]
MIGRLVWFAGLAAIALLTAVLQLDLMAARAPGVVPIVPSPLRNESQVAITRAALAGTDSARALAEAERLVQRRPIPARNLVLLSVSQAKAGKAEDAAKTIQIAAQRGWREPLAQEAMLRIALAAGDEAEAARRYAALFLRDGTPEPLLSELGTAVLAKPGGLGQSTMVAIVVGGERWHAAFLGRGPRVMPPAAFSAITADSLARGAAFDCAALGQSVRVLKRRDPAAAASLRTAAERRCPRLPR